MVIHVRTLARQILASNLYRFVYLASVGSVVGILAWPEETTTFGRVMAWVGAALLLAHTYTVKFAVREAKPGPPRVSPEEVARQSARIREMVRLAEQETRGSGPVIDAEFAAPMPTVETTRTVRKVTVRVLR